MHLTNPEVRAANRELADAYGNGWTVTSVPDDGQQHPRGKPCHLCSHDAEIR
jgi:hypothetical protein